MPNLSNFAVEVQAMSRTISQQDFAAGLQSVVSAVRNEGDCYIVTDERAGEPVALVPLRVLESYERSRARFADLLEEAGKSSGLTSEEAMAVALEEVAAVREARRRRRSE